MVAIGDLHGGHNVFCGHSKSCNRYCSEKWSFGKLGLVGISINRNANGVCVFQTLETIRNIDRSGNSMKFDMVEKVLPFSVVLELFI